MPGENRGGFHNPVLKMVVISGSPWSAFSRWVRTAQHWFQPLILVFGLFHNERTVGLDETLQNFFYKHTIDLDNVQMNKKKKRENLQDVKLVQTRCPNVSMSKIDCSSTWAIFLYVKSQLPTIGQPW
jgi:hypothetical protein